MSNYSDVTAEFNVEPVNDDGKDLAIGLSVSHGSISPGQKLVINVTFKPQIAGQFTSRQFDN